MTLIFDLIKYNGHLPITSPMNGFIYFFTQAVGILFFLLYFHQFVYLIVGSIGKAKVKNKEFKFHTLGIVISARNESKVIANLINSIRATDYPQAMMRIFVVADNCTDNTAEICRNMGCEVFERFDQTKIGKGYALNYLFTKLHTEPEYADKVPEAYVILDADNIVKSNFFTEINKVYDSGYEIVSSYRNSKNFGANWISSGYAYWFMHESRHLNNSRMILNSSCAISGTGFLISSAAVKEFGNWHFFLLTEDIQCSTEYTLTGRKVGYAADAEFYDEQPESFKQAWRQRERWCKGFYQVFGKYGGKLIKGSFKNFGCWDIITTIFPALLITMITITILPVTAIICLCMQDFANAGYAMMSLLGSFASLGLLMWLIAGLLCITEWKKIKCSGFKKILYVITFPLYMFTYIPISLTAMFKKVEWKPIVHNSTVSIEEIENQAEKTETEETNKENETENKE